MLAASFYLKWHVGKTKSLARKQSLSVQRNMFSCFVVFFFSHLGTCFYINKRKIGYFFRCQNSCWNWEMWEDSWTANGEKGNKIKISKKHPFLHWSLDSIGSSRLFLRVIIRFHQLSPPTSSFYLYEFTELINFPQPIYLYRLVYFITRFHRFSPPVSSYITWFHPFSQPIS